SAVRASGRPGRGGEVRRAGRLAGGAQGRQRRLRRRGALGLRRPPPARRRPGGRVPFVRALAPLVARSPHRQGAAYPVVETVQRDGICREVIAPAPGLAEGLVAEAQAMALRIANALKVTGLLAVELFETADGLLVNELAMRPHNTGHWTMDGAVTSQFEQHLRAVLDLPLGAPTMRVPYAVMGNLLGGTDPDIYDKYVHIMALDPGVKVHLYGKAVRPGRKLGHVTVLGDDPEELRDRARRGASYLRRS